MNETTATIKQLSAELHVSEQALRQWCKRNEIKKTTKGKVTSYFLSANDVEQIRKHYTTQRKQTHNESESKAQRKENNNVSLLSQLRAELAERDKIIDELRADKQKLNERLDKAEADRTELIEANKELTIALKAAQALHGMDKQQAAIELKEPAEQVKAAEQEPPKKKSWLDRLLRR